MQGLKFLILDENGTPINHGDILQTITPEKYLCNFTRVPGVCRVCDIAEIETWNLFRTNAALNLFIAEIRKQNPPPLPPDADEDNDLDEEGET